MLTWRNATGKTLSSPAWLDVHHEAKLPERTRFAQGLAQYAPASLVDLGCGTGLWLDLIDKHLPDECAFFGIDSDSRSLDLARERAHSWSRRSEFVECDISTDYRRIPRADLMLAFNVFPYLPDVSALLEHLRRERQADRVVIRQYDGGTMRVGPMPADDRFVIDSSLRASLEGSSEFDHYALDRTYQLARSSGFAVERLTFELTQRHHPFPASFEPYFRSTVEWIREHLSDDARSRLDRALAAGVGAGALYFAQTELVAVLSVPR